MSEANASRTGSEASDEDDVIGTRYLAPELSPLWAHENRTVIKRKLWIALAKIQKRMGFNKISEDGLEEMMKNMENVDIERLAETEEEKKRNMEEDDERKREDAEIEKRYKERKEEVRRLKREARESKALDGSGSGEEDIDSDDERERDIEREREIERRRKESEEKCAEGDDLRCNSADPKDPSRVDKIPPPHVAHTLTNDISVHREAFEELCPKAKGFLQLGASDNYISENCDLILMKKSLNILISKLFLFINYLMKKSHEYMDKALFTQTQTKKAHIITLGKRIAMWNSDLMDVFDQWVTLSFPFRGIKGTNTDTSGTNDKIFDMFDGDVKACTRLNTELAREFEFSPNKLMIVTGRSQMRAFEIRLAHLISVFSQTIFKIMSDVRHLGMQGEIVEGFAPGSEESELMIHKLTPMTCERACLLARYVIIQEFGMTHTYINHWFNKSMNDSSIRHVVMPEIFLLTEHIIDCSYIIFNKLNFNLPLIDKNVSDFIYHINIEEIIARGMRKGVTEDEMEDRIIKIVRQYEKAKKEELKQIEQEEKEGMKRVDKIPPWKACEIDVKTRQERAKSAFKSDPLILSLIDEEPMALNLISLNPKDFIGNAPSQVFQLNQFFSAKTSSLFWIR